MVGSKARHFLFPAPGRHRRRGQGVGRDLIQTGQVDWRRTSEGKAQEIERLVAPSLAELGYDIVRVLFGGDRRPRLQLMIERQDGKALDVDDCQAASRAAEALLDVEDPISGGYVLEVSSPGVDRPLTRAADFDKWAGFAAKVELAEAQDGRRRFSGTLLGLAEGRILLKDEKGEDVALPLANVTKAKLVLTDELLAAYATRPTAEHPEEGEAEIRPERPAGKKTPKAKRT